MAGVTINGREYRTSRKLNGKEQFHLSRRLGVLFAAITDVATASREESVATGPLMKRLGPVFEQLARMPDTEVDAILGASLKIVQRKEDKDRGWSDCWNELTNAPMHDDIDMMVMIQLVQLVIQENLANFTGALLSFTNGVQGA